MVCVDRGAVTLRADLRSAGASSPDGDQEGSRPGCAAGKRLNQHSRRMWRPPIPRTDPTRTASFADTSRSGDIASSVRPNRSIPFPGLPEDQVTATTTHQPEVGVSPDAVRDI